MKMLDKYYDAITYCCPERAYIQPIDVTAASRWFIADLTKADWNFREDFPIVTPPFRLMWMEHNLQRTMTTNGNIYEIPPTFEYAGCLSITREVDSSQGKAVIDQDLMRHYVDDIAEGMDEPIHWDTDKRNRQNQAALNAGREARCLVIWKTYLSTLQGEIYEVENFAAYLDRRGQIISENLICFGDPRVVSALGEDGMTLTEFLFATSLMHANNVKFGQVFRPDTIIEKLSGTAGRRSPPFKVLQINPIRNQVRQEGAGISTKRAMHIVRAQL